ncbi:MAG: CPBP family intramembrane glutamic endopeptidase [Flavitalea sp.]
MSLQTHKGPLIKQGWARALILLIAYVLLTVMAGMLIDKYLVPQKVASGQTVSPEIVITTSTLFFFTVSFIISIVTVFVCRKFLDKRSFVSLGLKPKYFFPGGIIGLLTGLFLVCTGALVIYSLDGLKWVDISFKAEDFFSSIILLIMVAVSEELVFRGYILRNFGKSFNQWLSLLITSVLFALVHISNPGIPVLGMINIFLGGLALGLAYMYSRNLWAPILFHFSWNFFQGPVLGFPVSGFPFSSILSAEETQAYWLNGGDFGFEGSVVCTVLLIVACTIFAWLNIERTPKPAMA